MGRMRREYSHLAAAVGWLRRSGWGIVYWPGCTFGKALAVSGAVLLTNTLIRDGLLNHARPLIYTTFVSNAAVIAVWCSFELLDDGTAEKVLASILPCRFPAPCDDALPFV